jgi:hypothetical protein
MIEHTSETKKVKSSMNFPLKDDFLFFSWNGKSSYDYNCFIENKNDLTFLPHPSFTNNFETPLYQNSRYFLGTSTEGKKFTLNLCFYNISLNEFRDVFANWLQLEAIGLLQFDYDKWYGYNCKLDSVGEAKKYINENSSDGYRYIIELSVGFETIDDNYALCRYFTTLAGCATFNSADKNEDSTTKNPIFTVSYSNLNSNEFNLEEIPASSISCNWELTPTSNENKFATFCFTLNNMGSLSTPFQVIVGGINNGWVKIFNSDPDKSDPIAWWDLNAQKDGIYTQYNSDTGLLTIGSQAANMTIINRLTALRYNKCAANVSLTPGISNLWIEINSLNSIEDVSNSHLFGEKVFIELSYRKRVPLI